MKEEEYLEQNVMKTLQSLDALEDIDAHPFLHTRLQAQIREYEENKERSTYLRFNMRDLRPVLLLLFLVFNILSVVFTIYYQADLRKDSLATFAEEYVLTQNVYSNQYSVFSGQ